MRVGETQGRGEQERQGQREQDRDRQRERGRGEERVSLGYRLWECHRKRLRLLRVGESESEREIAQEK